MHSGLLSSSKGCLATSGGMRTPKLQCFSVTSKVLSTRLRKPWSLRPTGRSRVQPRASSVSTAKRSKADIDQAEEEEEEEEEFEDLDSIDEEGALTTQQVHTLMNVVCQETDIAEVELKLGGFTMKVRRELTAGAAAPSAPALSGNGAAPTPTSANELPFQSTQSIDESQLLPSQQLPMGGSGSSMDEEDFNEHFIYLGAPKVGILRRGRYMKGKKIGKANVAEEGSRVKKGQALAFIEQLGTYVPIEAPQAGEIASFNVEDGTAVEYKEVVVEISPFFGGHIIGDKKYA